MAGEGQQGTGEHGWEPQEDLTALSEDGLRRALEEALEEGRVLSGRLELVRGRANLLRAELAGRRVESLGMDELARVLLGGGSGRGPGQTGRGAG